MNPAPISRRHFVKTTVAAAGIDAARENRPGSFTDGSRIQCGQKNRVFVNSCGWISAQTEVKGHCTAACGYRYKS